MRKIICGVLVTLIGLVFSVFFLVYAMQNPWDYNGIEGLLGSLLGTKTLFPLIISLFVMMAGLAYSFWIAYKKDK